MATVDTAAGTTVETPVDPDTRLSARIIRFLKRTPVHIGLALIAIFWLVPTTGLFITSLLTPSDAAQAGWWTFVTKPSTWTLENYANMFDNEGIVARALGDGARHDRRDDRADPRRRAGRLRTRLDRVPRPRLALPR